MPFRLEKSSCVVVGTFNMYILHPQWLARRGIIQKGVEVAIETNLNRPGFRFRFEKVDVVWRVTPERVVIESSDPQVDCGWPVGQVLDALPETPLVALGTNAHYRAEPSEVDSLVAAVREFPQTPSPNQGETVSQRTFHFSVRRGEHETISVQLSLKEEAVELHCNTQTILEDRQQADAIQSAIAAAERFFEDRAHSEHLAQHFFGATVHYAADH